MEQPARVVSPDSEAAAHYRKGVALHDAGEAAGAFSSFLMALALEPRNPAHRRMALRYLGLASGYKALPDAVIGALELCAADDSIDIQPLSLVVRNLLEADPRLDALRDLEGEALENALRAGQGDWLLNHKLLRAVLARALNISLPLENVLTALRKHACLRAQTVLLERHRDFLIALAAQCHASRFAWAESAAETEALTHMRSPDADTALVRAAYRPPAGWPAAAVALLPQELKRLRDVAETEAALADALPQLTPVADDTSRAVAAQYAAFPYPPWERPPAVTPRRLGEVLRERYPGAVEADRFNGAVDILSAGCGTGFGAIQLAVAVKDARVSAVDLSRPSLAFAARKAGEMACSNVTFGIADILQLPDAKAEWRGRFDMVECAGVLHHMADPAKGLAALKTLLKRDGVMRLAFYSERGRAAVVAARDFVAERKFPDTAEGVRAARFAIAALPARHAARGVMDSRDFFSLDGLHDLIFNVQEVRYHPRALKRLLADAGLTVFGVELPNPAWKAAFAARFPDPAAAADLEAWDAFEADTPDVFGEMIQLWCRPPNG